MHTLVCRSDLLYVKLLILGNLWIPLGVITVQTQEIPQMIRWQA